MPDSPARPSAVATLESLLAEIESVFIGKRGVVRLAVTALLARGHLLIEDVPGVGKTTLAHALAHALGLDFGRIQFTSDLLPSDVIGVSVFNPNRATFETRPGPIFNNIVLADEINRAPPRTQSGLLQAMQEGQVSIDDRTLSLPSPFLVMATQNPFEHHGTYPLPESQLDRFLMRLSIGYPDEQDERRILMQSSELEAPGGNARSVLSGDQVQELQAYAATLHTSDSVVDYLMEIVRRTREDGRLRLGVSPRGAIGLLAAARAHALLDGREFVVPEDVSVLVIPCLAHRVLPAGSGVGRADETEAILEEVVRGVPVPV